MIIRNKIVGNKIIDNNKGAERDDSSTDDPISFKRTVLSVCVMAALASGQAAAQSSSDGDTIEEIVTTGTRQSLQNAQNQKRFADTVKDVVTATDVGALPDKSVLEAVQRLPGVSIERFEGNDDPDHFSIEGSGVIVRGLTQTRSEFNGRDVFSASSGRGLSFQDVPPELIGSVELVKNQTADMIAGGIAGTINLVTRKPFDSTGQLLAFSGGMTYGDLSGESAPSYSGLYSNRWDTNAGEFGVLVNASVAELESRSDGFGVYNFFSRNADPDTPNGELSAFPGQDVIAPGGASIRTQDAVRDRGGFSGAFQWRNPGKDVLTTLQFTRSDAQLGWTERFIEFPDQPFGFPGFDITDGTVGSDGIVTDAVFNTNSQTNYIAGTRVRANDRVVDDYGLKVEYDVTDRLTLSADVQYVDAVTTVFDDTAHVSFASDVALGLNSGVPTVSFVSPTVLDTGTSFIRSALNHEERSDGQELALRLDAEYQLGDGWLKSVKVGVRSSEREQTVNRTKYNWGNVSETWAGGGLMSRVQDLPADFIDQFTFDDFHRGGNLLGSNQTFFLPSENLVADRDNFGTNIAPFTNGNYTTLANRGGTVNGGPFLPTETTLTNEDRQAAYIRLDFGSDDIGNGKGLHGNVGLRYIKYEAKSSGGTVFPTPFAALAEPFVDPAIFAFADGDGSRVSSISGGDYSKVLPSLNLNYGITDNLLLRFAYSEAVAFPDLGNLRNFTTITGSLVLDPALMGAPPTSPDDFTFTGWVGTSGNPALEPQESSQFDVSLEWYFADVGSLTAAVFYKDLTNFFVDDAFTREFTNNGATQLVSITGPTNAGSGKVQGFELAYQQIYDFLPAPFNGLGVQANFTYVDQSGVPNSGLRPGDPDQDDGSNFRTQDENFRRFTGLRLQGLSDRNVNLVTFYSTDRYDARLAYNWRSEFLLNPRDVIAFSPVSQEASGTLDGSFFYSINDNIRVGIEGSNLTDEVVETRIQFDQAGLQTPRSFFVSDRRYSLVFRGAW